jgi:hypothetical protein
MRYPVEAHELAVVGAVGLVRVVHLADILGLLFGFDKGDFARDCAPFVPVEARESDAAHDNANDAEVEGVLELVHCSREGVAISIVLSGLEQHLRALSDCCAGIQRFGCC